MKKKKKICDYCKKECDTYTFAKIGRIKSNGLSKKIPIVMMTKCSECESKDKEPKTCQYCLLEKKDWRIVRLGPISSINCNRSIPVICVIKCIECDLKDTGR